MTATAPTVFVVDDSPRIRKSLRTLLAAAGLGVETYASSKEFLAAYNPRQAGCLMLDVRLRGESGLDLLDELKGRAPALPVIILTAHGTVATSVRALKAGAIDFLEKPVHPDTLLKRIREALEVDRRRREAEAEREALERCAARLTRREREVAGLLVAGKRSKEIAAALGVTVRTIEAYRSRMLLKMNVASATELVSVLLRASVVLRS